MILGITGNFGVGKTTVAKMFSRSRGVKIIDADRIAHEVIKPGNPAYNKVINAFGRGILVGPYISRKRLAKIVFGNKAKLKKLNRITHPVIVKIIKKHIKNTRAQEILFIEAALLAKSELLRYIDKLVVVKSKSSVQIHRLKQKGLKVEQISQRLKAQSCQHKKNKIADFVIDNNGNKAQTQKQVKEVLRRIRPDATSGLL